MSGRLKARSVEKRSFCGLYALIKKCLNRIVFVAENMVWDSSAYDKFIIQREKYIRVSTAGNTSMAYILKSAGKNIETRFIEGMSHQPESYKDFIDILFQGRDYHMKWNPPHP